MVRFLECALDLSLLVYLVPYTWHSSPSSAEEYSPQTPAYLNTRQNFCGTKKKRMVLTPAGCSFTSRENIWERILYQQPSVAPGAAEVGGTAVPTWINYIHSLY